MPSKLPTLSTRVSLAHKARIRAAAKAAGLRLSDWLRRAIGRELVREMKVPTPSSSGPSSSDAEAVEQSHD